MMMLFSFRLVCLILFANPVSSLTPAADNTALLKPNSMLALKVTGEDGASCFTTAGAAFNFSRQFSGWKKKDCAIRSLSNSTLY
ncbi:hypothetical protein D3C80_1678560 [compost metagenome]